MDDGRGFAAQRGRHAGQQQLGAQDHAADFCECCVGVGIVVVAGVDIGVGVGNSPVGTVLGGVVGGGIGVVGGVVQK